MSHNHINIASLPSSNWTILFLNCRSYFLPISIAHHWRCHCDSKQKYFSGSGGAYFSSLEKRGILDVIVYLSIFGDVEQIIIVDYFMSHGESCCKDVLQRPYKRQRIVFICNVGNLIFVHV